MARNRSEKHGIIAHKTVTPANWQVLAHAFLFKKDDSIWLLCHTSSRQEYIDHFVGRCYPANETSRARSIYDTIVNDFWFAELGDSLESIYEKGIRATPPGWSESKERKQCVAERERV